MPMSIRRLQPGDEAILIRLAADVADYELDEHGSPSEALSEAAARRFLANPAVLYWVAIDGDTVLASLHCAVVAMASDDGDELLLYEIGVHRDHRRAGVGRALMAEMDAWMEANGVEAVWVLADNPGAVSFYQACGFNVEREQPVYLTREPA